MSEERYLTFALGKGRLAKKTLELFEQIGITCEEMKDKDSRKLIFTNEELKLRFFLAKGPDVPTYVEYGAADIGIVGKDTILEEGRKLYEVRDLGGRTPCARTFSRPHVPHSCTHGAETAPVPGWRFVSPPSCPQS